MYRYEVNYWNEDTCEPMYEKGIVAASSYGAAVDNVVNYYGKNNIGDIKIYELEDILTDKDINDFTEEVS